MMKLTAEVTVARLTPVMPCCRRLSARMRAGAIAAYASRIMPIAGRHGKRQTTSRHTAPINGNPARTTGFPFMRCARRAPSAERSISAHITAPNAATGRRTS